MAPATPITGVNAIDLTFSATPIADIIAEAAVTSGNGILTVPFSQGQAAAFAVATSNVGASGQLYAQVDTGSATLPLTLNMCQTNPDNGQCLPPYAPQVPITIAAGATPTFSVFVSATGAVPFDPGNSRVFVHFFDNAGNSHGSTSVAVETD